MSPRSRLLVPLLLSPLACATPKVAATDVLAPELVVHTVPEGSEVIRDNAVIGHAPVHIPLKPGDTTLELSSQRGGYFPAKVTVDAAGARQAGGGEAWIALKPEPMGSETALDPSKAADLDRAGISLSRTGRCDEAMEFFARAIAVDANFAKAHKDRAHCFIQGNQREAAAADLERYLLLAPDAPDAPKVQEEVSKLHGHRDIDLGPSPSKGAR